ncbi:superoxide dismutase family protein [Pseudonocardia phyllosphaerae]|uniref:superoxide dismutase family protein n=1 Tax=Pseudonocardia phyllosphaerae TaxID=3390502 RepID=UPI00397E5CE9
MMLRHAALPAAALALVACAGCSSSGVQTASSSGENATQVSATFAQGGNGPAFTYNPELVPAGSKVEVSSSSKDDAVTTTLKVEGLKPNRTYGAHAHVNACSPTDGEAAGPHFQFEQDPVKPSVDPAFANPQNEIWLDVTTDAQGAGEATSTVKGSFPDDRKPKSVVIHEKATETHAGHAGKAGSRPGCVNVEF